MLKIKLTPTGKTHDRHYRIVVTPDRSKLTGRAVDTLGHFHPGLPKSHPRRLVLDKEKLELWMARGAVPTDKIRRLAK